MQQRILRRNSVFPASLQHFFQQINRNPVHFCKKLFMEVNLGFPILFQGNIIIFRVKRSRACQPNYSGHQKSLQNIKNDPNSKHIAHCILVKPFPIAPFLRLNLRRNIPSTPTDSGQDPALAQPGPLRREPIVTNHYLILIKVICLVPKILILRLDIPMANILDMDHSEPLKNLL